MKNLKQQLVPLAFLLLILVLDQLSKYFVLRHLQEGVFVDVIGGFFSMTLHYNPGVAFGMFADWAEPGRTIVLSCAKLFALGLCLWLLRNQYKNSLWGQVAIAMIIGGAIGNIIDRSLHGEVIDFLDFYYQNYHWPTFNLADSAICIGVVLLLLLPDKRKQPQEALAG